MEELEKALSEFRELLEKAGSISAATYKHPDDFKSEGLDSDEHNAQSILHGNTATSIKKYVVQMKHPTHIKDMPHINDHIAEFTDRMTNHYDNSMKLKGLHEKAAGDLERNK